MDLLVSSFLMLTRLLGEVAKDCSLLTTGISSAPELQWEPTRLFKRYPDLQEVMEATPSRYENLSLSPPTSPSPPLAAAAPKRPTPKPHKPCPYLTTTPQSLPSLPCLGPTLPRPLPVDPKA